MNEKLVSGAKNICEWLACSLLLGFMATVGKYSRSTSKLPLFEFVMSEEDLFLYTVVFLFFTGIIIVLMVVWNWLYDAAIKSGDAGITKWCKGIAILVILLAGTLGRVVS
jgi:hypothetical protein